MYSLKDLLIKMGAPEVRERGRVHWHYFDKERQDIAGSAEIRLDDDGHTLVAELKHLRPDYEDDNGRIHTLFTETFHMRAIRSGKDKFKVQEIGFDGEIYHDPQKPVIELGLSIFHARALDISILMVEQAFNRQEMLDPLSDVEEPANSVWSEAAAPAQNQASAVIVPFPVRKAGGPGI